MHTGQAEAATLMEVGQAFVINTQQVRRREQERTEATE